MRCSGIHQSILHKKIESLWHDAVTLLALAQQMIDTSTADDTGKENHLFPHPRRLAKPGFKIREKIPCHRLLVPTNQH
jgi:hypothetical protein